jgi:NCS2 family nucleobase:cation symporter-2
METGFAVTAFLALILNLLLSEDIEDEAVDVTANTVDEAHDQKEWERIRRPSTIRAARKSQEIEDAKRASVSEGMHAIHDVEKMNPVQEA